MQISLFQKVVFILPNFYSFCSSMQVSPPICVCRGSCPHPSVCVGAAIRRKLVGTSSLFLLQTSQTLELRSSGLVKSALTAEPSRDLMQMFKSNKMLVRCLCKCFNKLWKILNLIMIKSFLIKSFGKF